MAPFSLDNLYFWNTRLQKILIGINYFKSKTVEPILYPSE